MDGRVVRAPIAIRYRDPRKADLAGLIIIAGQSRAEEAREDLVKRGYVILDDALPGTTAALET
jgi:hypothetical protein